MGFLWSKLLEQFFTKKLEICLLGLEMVGKTTFVDSIMGIHKQTLPTIGLNVKQVRRGNLSMKIWDIGGQFQFRQNWIDYAKMGDVIIFMVDSSNYETITIAKKELHSLLEEKGIEGKPLLILSNKIDVDPHMSEVEVIKELNLDYLYSNQWAVIPVSSLQGTNLDNAIDWLSKKGKS